MMQLTYFCYSNYNGHASVKIIKLHTLQNMCNTRWSNTVFSYSLQRNPLGLHISLLFYIILRLYIIMTAQFSYYFSLILSLNLNILTCSLCTYSSRPQEGLLNAISNAHCSWMNASIVSLFVFCTTCLYHLIKEMFQWLLYQRL